MRLSMLTADKSLTQLSAEIDQLTADFERKNGPVQTSDIIKHNDKPVVWNGTLVIEGMAKQNAANSYLNRQIQQRYAKEPCLTALAKELGISINSLTKRAARMGVSRCPKTKAASNPSVTRAVQRLEKTAKMLEANKSVEEIAQKLDISDRLVRQYRQQIEAMQEAA